MLRQASSRLRFGTAVAALAVGAGMVSVMDAPAHADTTRLELPGYGDLVVDDDHDHLFISGGPSSNGVVVTNLSGHVRATIEGQYGATGLALDIAKHRLYVANAAGDAISVVDLHTFKEVDRIPTGAQTCPTHLTRIGEVLWFGYGCDDTWSGGIGKVEFPVEPTPEPTKPAPTGYPVAPSPGSSVTTLPTKPPATAYPQPREPGTTASPRPTKPVPTASPTPKPRPKVTRDLQGSELFQRAPLLAAPNDEVGPLVAGQLQLSRSTVYVYDISATATLTTRTSSTAPGSNLYDIALDCTAETLFTGAGSRNAVQAYSPRAVDPPADLSGRGSYYTGYHPLAVAPSPDGFHLAAGVRSTGDDVYVYEIDGVVPERRINFRDQVTDDVLAPRGLTWAPDSRTLYAITQPPAGGEPTLRVITDPTA